MPQVAEWREQKLEVMRLEAAIAERDRLRCLEQLQKQEQEEKNRRKQQKQQVVHHKLAYMAPLSKCMSAILQCFLLYCQRYSQRH